MENTLLDLVINWDQTSRADRSSSFVCGWGKKEKKKQARQGPDNDEVCASVKLDPREKWKITAMLTVTASGRLLPG